MGRNMGFPGGGMGNMQNLMKQAQKMQKQMEEQAKALGEKEFSVAVGGGALSIKCNGERKILECLIDEDIMEKDNKEMLEDMIVTAVNDIMSQVDKEASKGLSGLGGFGF